MKERLGYVKRDTKETQIDLLIDLNGSGKSEIDTEVGFFNHMLTLFSFHSGVDLKLKTKGDIEVCDHHLVEDVGIALGQALKEALGDKIGIKRYGTVFVPMDEALTMVTLDISGRSFLHFEGEFKRESIGNFSTEMVLEFFRAVAFNSGITVHCRILYGENDHHKIEGLFKAFGRALREAIEIVGNDIPSTKGAL